MVLLKSHSWVVDRFKLSSKTYEIGNPIRQRQLVLEKLVCMQKTSKTVLSRHFPLILESNIYALHPNLTS